MIRLFINYAVNKKIYYLAINKYFMNNSTIYYLWIHNDIIGNNLIFTEYPDLKAKYIKYQNNICSSIHCAWEGDLQIVLEINGKEIIINDRDLRKIQGLGHIIQKKKIIIKHSSNSKSNGNRCISHVLFDIIS